MESPVKKIDFSPADKENQPAECKALAALAKKMDEEKKTKVEEVETDSKTEVAETKPEHIDEPLLQENPQRFVLFPIRYHEVSGRVTTRKVAHLGDMSC